MLSDEYTEVCVCVCVCVMNVVHTYMVHTHRVPGTKNTKVHVHVGRSTRVADDE